MVPPSVMTPVGPLVSVPLFVKVPALVTGPLLVIVPRFVIEPVSEFVMSPLLVMVPVRPFVTGPLLVIVPDDVMVPVLLNVFVVVRIPDGPIVIVPVLTIGPLLVIVPRSVIKPMLLRVTADAMISAPPEMIVKVETAHVEVVAVQVPPKARHEAWSCSVTIPVTIPGVIGPVSVLVTVVVVTVVVLGVLVVVVVVTARPEAVIVSSGPVVTAPLDKMLPRILTVVPTVMAALVSTLPAKRLFAPRVTAPTGTQNMLAGFAFANTISELATVLRAPPNLKRKVPEPLKVTLWFMETAPAMQ